MQQKTTVSALIARLKNLPKGAIIQLASDEEWNSIYTEVDFQQDSESKAFVLFGHSQSMLDL